MHANNQIKRYCSLIQSKSWRKIEFKRLFFVNSGRIDDNESHLSIFDVILLISVLFINIKIVYLVSNRNKIKECIFFKL